MINKYLEFISENFVGVNEGSSYNPTVLYWEENLNEILNYKWYDISTDRWNGSIYRWNGSIYTINFKVDINSNPSYYIVVLENKFTSDLYYMENSEPFMKKFKNEFNSNPIEYYKNLKYIPKVLGNLDHIKNASKFNI